MKELIGYKKGINLGGWISQKKIDVNFKEDFILEDDIKFIKSIGLDHVRLPVDFEYIYDEKNKVDNPLGYKLIDACISWCEKYNLNLILDLHKAPGYVFDDQDNSDDFFKNESLQNLFYDIWDRLSKRYSKYEHMMMFELLNEVGSPDVINEWNEIALKAIKVIRKNAPKVKILFGGVDFSNINAVKYIPAPVDENIVYNVHCYEPLPFTHQGAYWIPDMPKDFSMPYPIDENKFKELCEIVPRFKETLFGNLDNTINLLKHNFFINFFKEAVEYAEKNNTSLYCGEYGVIDRADPHSTLNWLKDINEAFEKYHMGRALWSYKEMDFGLIGDHYKEIFSEIIKYL